MIFYESPFRLVKALKEFAEAFGKERKASVSRELSKMFEEHFAGAVSEVLLKLKSQSEIRGEFVVCVNVTEANNGRVKLLIEDAANMLVNKGSVSKESINFCSF